jgi:hypothetical protein
MSSIQTENEHNPSLFEIFARVVRQCECCDRVVLNPDNLGLFDLMLYDIDSVYTISSLVCRECVNLHGGNWEEALPIIDALEDPPDLYSESDRIYNNLKIWKPYNFSHYTTNSYNDYCYKYGLKMIGEP